MKLTDTQKKLAEQLLLSVKKRESVVEYNELADRISPPIFWRQVGREIGEISKLCKELGLPLLSAKVISRGSGKAGAGFYKLMKQLGIDTKGKTENELFSEELKKIRECKEWYKLADYLNLDLDLPRPEEKKDGQIPADTPAESSWIIPSNSETYDVLGAFQKFTEIDWRQNANYKAGDTIYIYCAKPFQRIIYQTKVQQIDISLKDTIDDREFWVDTGKFETARTRTYARLKLIKGVDTELLSLNNLLDNGLKTAPQGPLRAMDRLEAYIESVFEQTASFVKGIMELPPLPEELVATKGETFNEGAKKQIIVNAYERNPIARYKCIRIHGNLCAICDFDFGAYYGPDLEGKIHVHHIKPLHLIDDNYKVDPERDLVPVCPNCHMVLHSKQDGVYSVEEVRHMVAKNGRHSKTVY